MSIRIEHPMGSGNVNHFSSSTDNAIARWDSTAGTILQNSGITLSDLNVIDLAAAGTLAIGTGIATTTSIGKSGATLNLVGSTVGLGVTGASINITGTTITIGESGATVNILGTTNYTQTTNLQVSDMLITLNKGGITASAVNCGFEIEENSSITGYIKTESGRDSFTIKAPNTAGIITLTPGASNFTLDNTVVKSTTSTSTDNRIARYDSTTGRLIQESLGAIDDAGVLTGITGITMTGDVGITGNITVSGTVDGVDVSTFSTNTGLHISASSGVHGATGAIVGTTDTQALENKTIDADKNTLSNIENADIKAAAAIAVNKLAALTASCVVITDASGFLTVDSSVSSTEVGYLNGVTGAIQTQIDSKVAGPASSTDNAIVRFDGTNVKVCQNSAVTIDDSGFIGFANGTIQHGTFAAANNQSAAANVTGFLITGSRSFRAQISVHNIYSSTLSEIFDIYAVYDGTSWSLTYTQFGDVTGTVFSITSGGQLQYTSTNMASFTSSAMKWVVTTTNA